MAVDDALVDAYLARLGEHREPPSIDALRRLHRAHVARVPYETIWIHLGEAWDIDPIRSAQRIARHARGGYCFHLNGAFSELLLALGYHVSRHVGTVHGPDGPTPDAMGNHLALIVVDLPGDSGISEWHVDVGLGDALLEPLPLRIGASDQVPFRLAMERPDAAHWRLLHDPSHGSFTAMTFALEAAEMSGFAAKHQSLSTSPESRFVRTLTVQRRDTRGADVLRGLMLRRADTTDIELENPEDFFTMLADVFGLPLPAASASDRNTLWRKLATTHQAWLDRGRPTG